MDNENSLDEKYSELKKCLACGKKYRTMEEFINHARDSWHDELIISSYSKYIDERETSKIIKYIEYNKNKLTIGNSDLGIYLGKMMIYNVLTTKPRDTIDHFINGRLYNIINQLIFLLRFLNQGT